MTVESEVINLGSIFLGIGLMVVFFAIGYMFYHIARIYKNMVDKEQSYDVLETSLLYRVAAKQGIDLEKEVQKRDVLNRKKKNFRRKLEEEIYEEMFGKENKKAK